MAFTYALDPTTPTATDFVKNGDDEIRLVKNALIERINSFFVNVDTNPWTIKDGAAAGQFNTKTLLPVADASYNIGSASFRYVQGWFSGAVSIGGTLTGVDGIFIKPSSGGPVMTLSNGTAPTFTEYYKSSFTARVAVGALGSIEANLSFNMNYASGQHRLYDQTMSASWFTMGNAGQYIQYAPNTMAAGDIWQAGGYLTNLEIVGASGNTTLRGSLKIGEPGTGDGNPSPPNAAYAFEIKNSTLTGVNQYGLVSNPTFSSGATTSGIVMAAQVITAAASFTMVTGRALYIPDASKGAGSAITTLIGIDIADQTQGATNIAIRTGLGGVELGGRVYAKSVADNIRLYADGTNANDATLSVSAIGNIKIGHWAGAEISIAATGPVTISAKLNTLASAAGSAGLNIAPGAAPTVPVNGDEWSTAAGRFCRVNGVTKQYTLT